MKNKKIKNCSLVDLNINKIETDIGINWDGILCIVIYVISYKYF